MEAGSGEELPSVTITVSAGGGEEDDQSLNDLVLQQDFGRCGWFGALVIVFLPSFVAPECLNSFP